MLVPSISGAALVPRLAHLRDEGQFPFSEGSLLHFHPTLIVSKFFHLLIAISFHVTSPIADLSPLEGHKSHLEGCRLAGWSCLPSTEGSEPMRCHSLLVFPGNEKNPIIIVINTHISVCYIVSELNGTNSEMAKCLYILPSDFFILFNKIPADQ